MSSSLSESRLVINSERRSGEFPSTPALIRLTTDDRLPSNKHSSVAVRSHFETVYKSAMNSGRKFGNGCCSCSISHVYSLGFQEDVNGSVSYDVDDLIVQGAFAVNVCEFLITCMQDPTSSFGTKQYPKCNLNR